MSAKQKRKGGIVVDGAESAKAALTLDERLPGTLFVFPLRKSVPFPNLMMPVLLDTPESKDIVAKAEAGNGHLLLLTVRDPEEKPSGPQDYYEVGVVARILKTLTLPDGNASVMVQGRTRARVRRFVRSRPNAVARVDELIDVPTPGPRTEAAFRQRLGGQPIVVGTASVRAACPRQACLERRRSSSPPAQRSIRP